MKGNKRKSKQSPPFWIYTRAAHMDISDKRHYLKFEKRNNIYKQVFEPFPHDCSKALSKAGWGLGADLSQVVGGRAKKGGAG